MGTMRTVVLDVRTLEQTGADFAKAWKTRKSEKHARISFETPELLWRVLTEKRWQILKAMTGQGELGVREVARRVERDVKAVHADLHALLDAGVINKTDSGKLEFPFDAVHVDFVLEAA
jgi:predicted transcriptional regulator